MTHDWISPDWSAPAQIKALLTTRNGGVSLGHYAGRDGGGLNLGDNTGDHPDAVQQNKAILRHALPSEPVWLRQVHGTAVLRLPVATSVEPPVADAVFTITPGVVCAVRTADCLPVLLADRLGRAVGVAHAGWRGLAAGVVEHTVAAMRSALPQADLIAYLGPAIGPLHFEVGAEVRAAFMALDPQAEICFQRTGPAKWRADLPMLARQRLQKIDISCTSGGNLCTYSEAGRFYSFRRDADTGRMASCIWIEPLS